MILVVRKNVICFFIALLLTPLIVFRLFHSVSLSQMFFLSLVMVLFCNFVNKSELLLECITLFLNLILATCVSEYFLKQGYDYLFPLVMSCIVAHTLAYSLLYSCIFSCGAILAIGSMTVFDYIQILLFLFCSFVFFFFRQISFNSISYFSIPTQKLF